MNRDVKLPKKSKPKIAITPINKERREVDVWVMIPMFRLDVSVKV